MEWGAGPLEPYPSSPLGWCIFVFFGVKLYFWRFSLPLAVWLLAFGLTRGLSHRHPHCHFVLSLWCSFTYLVIWDGCQLLYFFSRGSYIGILMRVFISSWQSSFVPVDLYYGWWGSHLGLATHFYFFDRQIHTGASDGVRRPFFWCCNVFNRALLLLLLGF